MLAFPNDSEAVVRTSIAVQVRNSSGYVKRARKDLKRKSDLATKYSAGDNTESCSQSSCALSTQRSEESCDTLTSHFLPVLNEEGVEISSLDSDSGPNFKTD